MKKRVYIAGPMSQGDRLWNIHLALSAYRTLMEEGYAPLCPQLTFLVEGLFPENSHADWLSMDVPWVEVSDVVLRLPGNSRGADEEELVARNRGVPVVYSVSELLEKFPPSGGMREGSGDVPPPRE